MLLLDEFVLVTVEDEDDVDVVDVLVCELPFVFSGL